MLQFSARCRLTVTPRDALSSTP